MFKLYEWVDYNGMLGQIVNIDLVNCKDYPLHVKFINGMMHFTIDGRINTLMIKPSITHVLIKAMYKQESFEKDLEKIKLMQVKG